MTLTFLFINLHVIIKTAVYTNFRPDLQLFHDIKFFKHFPTDDLAEKRSRSTQGRHLNNLGRTRGPNATCEV